MGNISWVFGVLKHEYNVDTDGMTPKDAFEELREQQRRDFTLSNKKHIELPKDEYAGLCSAIRTKNADKIPNSGKMFYKDCYYWYNYNKDNELILCTRKIEIAGNEELIAELDKERNK